MQTRRSLIQLPDILLQKHPLSAARYFSFSLLAVLLISQIADAQSGPAIDFKKMASLVVEVVDDQGKPVAGATVYPYAMRAAENANGHGYWNDELIGPPKMEVTDVSGRATIHYPVNIGAPTEPRTTGMVTFEVKHTDYVRVVTHFDLGPEVARVEMKAGCEIQLSAVDADGKPVSAFAVAVAGRLAPDYWADGEKGSRRTRAASDGTWQTMLIKPQPDGRTLFSGVLPLRVRPDQDVTIRNIKLLPGMRVSGELSENVPRPVKAGVVIACCAPKPAENSYAEKDPSIVWHDWSEIREDGSFEFASLPRCGEMQLIAICDGWLSSTIPASATRRVEGQLFQLEKEESQFEPTVQMEQTGTLELTVLGPNGEPLAEGEVSGWPNQVYLKGGSTLLGSHYRSIDYFERQLLPPQDQQQIRFRRDQIMPYQGKLVDGKVTLRGFPIGHNEPLALMHPQYVFKGEEGYARIQLDSPEPKAMTLKAVLPIANNALDPEKLLQQAGDLLKSVLPAKKPAKGE